MQSRIQTVRINAKDEDVLKFVRQRIKGSAGNAIKEALKRYAKMCGYKEEKIDNAVRHDKDMA